MATLRATRIHRGESPIGETWEFPGGTRS